MRYSRWPTRSVADFHDDIVWPPKQRELAENRPLLFGSATPHGLIGGTLNRLFAALPGRSRIGWESFAVNANRKSCPDSEMHLIAN